jgi:hypothetical protein
MTRDDALAILDLGREEAIVIMLALAEKAEKYDLSRGQKCFGPDLQGHPDLRLLGRL